MTSPHDSSRAQAPALLKGLIFSDTGAAMTPTSTKKGAKLYRYYVSMDVIRNRETGAEAAPTDATSDVATLQVLSEQWADTPISHDQFGRAQEFSLRYAVIFSMRRADGSAAVPQQAVELSRDYLAPAVDSIGKASERELLVRELRRDMAAAILRRVDAASKPAAAAQ